ncbi:hypothetical protein [Methanothrix soehngenii]|uniref:hypothetical protein n=1 Tax=Methanothrix soehngenii TaxID=2223 RepID=UPI00300C9B79
MQGREVGDRVFCAGLGFGPKLRRPATSPGNTSPGERQQRHAFERLNSRLAVRPTGDAS